jgi:hypothetical protein
MFRSLNFSGRFVRFAALASALALLVAAWGARPVSATNTTYYVDCTGGNDANNGTSTTTAWRTIARANQPTYGPGDQILLKRGCVWTGVAGASEGFEGKGNGTTTSVITLADYGSGALPKIDAYQDSAVLLQNVQNWTVRNLDVTQHGGSPECIDFNFEPSCPAVNAPGIVDVSGIGPVGVQACGEPCTARNIRLESLVVHEGQWVGIFIHGGLYDVDLNVYGYVDNVVVINTEMRNNHKHGLEATGTYTKNITYPTKHISTLNSYAHDNGGDGIVYGPVEFGLIDGNQCAFNGLLRNARVGCWTWDSHDTVMQFNESHHTQNPKNDKEARDGGGFDCDLGSEDCLIQYNWAHDNVGEGYLLMQWPIGYGYQRGESHNIQMRYNIGERDAKKLAAGILIFGGPTPTIINNNVIYYEPERLAGTTMYTGEGSAFGSGIWGKSGSPTVYFYNNILIVNGTVHPNAVSYIIKSDGAGTFNIDNNLHWRVEGGVQYFWANAIITTWAGWQAKGFDANGVNANPLIVGPVGGGPNAYKLTSGSPAIDHGRTFNVGLRGGVGPVDYFGSSVPQGAAVDIGAAEFAGGGGGPTNTPAPPTNTPTATSTRTNTPVPTATNTPGGPTNTPTATPTRTNTPLPPTATNTPSGGANLALNKPVTVSSTNDAVASGGDKAVDGNLTTLWRSRKRSTLPSEWITVDLGSSLSIDTVVLKWGGYYATGYTIQVSNDNTNWTTVSTTTGGDGGTDTLTFGAVSARYVKMDSTVFLNNAERDYLIEFEIYQ